MADLRSCYFCGTGPGGSLDSYGVVPSALDPSSDEQRSVVLCPDCRNKLTALLEPVVGAAEASKHARSGSSGLSPADEEVTGLAETTGGVAETGQGSGGSSPADDSATANSSGEESSSGASAEEPAAGGPAAEASPTGEPASDPSQAGEQAGGTSQAGEPAGGTSRPSEPGGGASQDGGASVGGSTADGQDGSGESSGEGLADTTGGRDDPEGPPRDPSAEAMMGNDSEAYRKVIRLLQNRDFPVRRAEIEELAMNAYELGPGECSGAIDTIVQKGLLVEDEGMLRRPED